MGSDSAWSPVNPSIFPYTIASEKPLQFVHLIVFSSISYTQDVASDRSTANTAVHAGEEGDYNSS